MTVVGADTVPFDADRYFTTIEAQSELLSDALETGDPTYIAIALGTIARARGRADFAQESGVAREGPDQALSLEDDPRLSTLIGMMKALNLEFRAVPAVNRG